MELQKVVTDVADYPVGRLDDVEIHFVHYHSFEKARQKWEERKNRINKQKIFIMATDRDGMNTDECMKKFDKLPYHKVIYTAKKWSTYTWAVFCPYFKKNLALAL